MPVTIKRESAFFRSYSALNIYLDGEKVDTITSGEKKEIDVPRDGAVLKVSQFGGKSNTLKVYKGDFIRLSVAPWAPWFLLLIFLIYPLLINASNSFHPWATLLLILCGYYLVFNYMETYQLAKDPSRKLGEGGN